MLSLRVVGIGLTTDRRPWAAFLPRILFREELVGGVEKCSAEIFLKEHTCVSRGALAGNCLVFSVRFCQVYYRNKALLMTEEIVLLCFSPAL